MVPSTRVMLLVMSALPENISGEKYAWGRRIPQMPEE